MENNYPDTPDGLLAKELNAWYKEQGKIITEQILKQNKMKDINEIIDELRQHPDYVASSIWTTELVTQEICNQVESMIEEEDNVDFFVDEVYKRNIKQI
jgi:CTP:phosphocholine cytidylyltransferase-like protein